MFNDARGTIRLTNEVAANVKTVLKSADTAIGQAESVLTNINGMISPNTAQRIDIDETLRNLAVTTRSLRGFSEQLERKPNAIVMGR